MATQRNQKTIQHPVSFSGIGIHTGHEVNLRLVPAPEGHGIVFKRIDLHDQPCIPAHVSYVKETPRSTNIGKGDVRICTVEHLLAALRAYEIDNLLIEIDAPEPPIGDGSSAVFVDLIEKVGVCEQNKKKEVYSLESPVFWSEGEIHLVAIPSCEYRISYTLHYPQVKALKTQYFSLEINQENFKKELSCCRTFVLYHEVAALMDRGLIKGGSLDNGVVIDGETIFSKEGLHFPDEMVRHKILDMVGDLSLMNIDLRAHILAVRAGHASNVAFAKKLLTHLKMEDCP